MASLLKELLNETRKVQEPDHQTILDFCRTDDRRPKPCKLRALHFFQVRQLYFQRHHASGGAAAEFCFQFQKNYG